MQARASSRGTDALLTLPLCYVQLHVIHSLFQPNSELTSSKHVRFTATLCSFGRTWHEGTCIRSISRTTGHGRNSTVLGEPDAIGRSDASARESTCPDDLRNPALPKRENISAASRSSPFAEVAKQAGSRAGSSRLASATTASLYL